MRRQDLECGSSANARTVTSNIRRPKMISKESSLIALVEILLNGSIVGSFAFNSSNPCHCAGSAVFMNSSYSTVITDQKIYAVDIWSRLQPYEDAL